MRIALLVEYDGKRFHGSQFQAGVRTVQSELETALAKFFRIPCRAHFSGRTDSGVHACGQVVHFDLDEASAEGLDLWRICWGLNGIIGEDMSIRKGQIVPADFHARYKAVKREYVYQILNEPQRSAFYRDTHFFVPRQLNIQAMTEAASYLLGKHDFTGFRSTNADNAMTECHVQRAELLQLPHGRLAFCIAADRFVYNMVRIIVGTLLEVGTGKRTPQSLAEALDGKDRSLAGTTAPAWGLTLSSVHYPEHFKLFASPP